MPPITWQNINGPSLSQAAGPLAAATQTFNNAFGDLRDTLKERQSIEDGNWQNQKTNNTNAFLDAVSKYTDPDKLKAAQADPNSDLNKMRAQFGNQVDMDKVRGAADTRMAQTMQQARDSIAYQDVMRNEKTAPLVDQYRDAVMRKDVAGAQAARESYLAAGGRNAADLDVFADHRQRELTERGQHDQRFGMDMRTGQSNIDHQRAEEAIGRTQAAAATSNAASQAQSVKQQGQYQNWQMSTATEAAQAAKAAGKVAAYRKELADSGNLYAKEGVWDGSQSGDFMDMLTKNKIGDDPGERSAMIARISQIAKEGIKIKSPDGKQSITIHDLPVSALRTALMGATDQMVNGWNQGYANEMKNNLTSILQAEAIKQDKGGNAVLTNKMSNDLEAFRSMLSTATSNAQPLRPVVPSTQMPGARRK